MTDINVAWPVQGNLATTEQIRSNFRATQERIGSINVQGSEYHWPVHLYLSGGVNFSSSEIIVSGGARFYGNQVSISGGLGVTGEYGLSGGPHYIYQSWNWYNAQASFCGSIFNCYSYSYGVPLRYYNYISMSPDTLYLSGNEIRMSPSSLYISGSNTSFTNWVSISGGIGITGQFGLSGGAHYLYTQGWDSRYSNASFCGSAFNMYTSNYNTWLSIYVTGGYTTIGGNDIYISGYTAFSNEVVMSGGKLGLMCPLYMSGSNNQDALVIENHYTTNPNAIRVVAGSVTKPGGGAWGGTSDSRTKTDVKAYEAGLKELMQLDAQSFRYNGRGRIMETGKRFVSIAAEQAREVMPEMVEAVRGKLEYDDEEETDILQLNATPLIYASLNAIKEIAKSLEKINERLDALEGKDK